METKKENKDGKLVVLIHLTLKPGVDDELIQLVCNAPRRYLAGRVREAMHRGLTLKFRSSAEMESPEVLHG